MMALRKSAIPIEEKKVNAEVKQHPWTKIIKDNLLQNIKYAHNSVKNPRYPVKQQNHPDSQESDENRVQFAVIGDRVTKEFIFCCNLVRGLHKYRWKNFDVPLIRGVSTVEWPHVWNDLKIRLGTVAACLQSSVAVFRNDEIVGGERELKQLVETQYIYHLCLDYYNEGVAQFSRFIKSSGRPTAYLHVSIDDKHIGTLIFMLYADIVPSTCDNFLRLCKETRGGYGGTPVHRIVKDGWIQCGGFGLKSTPLTCENFIIPFDRRGVLAMANDGRDIDCSTQFFVLLQPSPWMSRKYVAFGQLIEGAATLKKIERVTTWHESPTSKIILYRCGILNMECHDIRINKGANQYIDRHTEDLTDFSDRLWEHILEKVFLEAELREIDRLREQGGEGAESIPEDGALRLIQRFKKEDTQKQIERNQGDQRSAKTEDNNEFDVDEYVYEPEEDIYKHQSLHPGSLVVKPRRPYYLPLTDVPYPGDVDSDFNLRGLLQGQYCLESDLEKDAAKLKTSVTRFPSEILMQFESEILPSDAPTDIDSEVDEELDAYVKNHSERVSFAGDVVRNIAKQDPAKFNLQDERTSVDSRIQGHINDEKLRKIRLASIDLREQEERIAAGRASVKIRAPVKLATQIKRRQTGFVRQKDLENIRIINDSEDDDDDDDSSDSKTVRLNPIDVVKVEKADQSRPSYLAQRRPTGFIRPADLAKFISYDVDDDDDDDDNDDDGDSDYDDDDEIKPYFRPSETYDNADTKPSVLARLFKQVDIEDENVPTLKSFESLVEINQRKNTLLTYSPMTRLPSKESIRAKYKSKAKETSVDQILDLQHGKRITRKISTDYVKTIQRDHRIQHSLRTVEYAKTRPTMTVSEYQMKNRKYREGLQLHNNISNQFNTIMMPSVNFGMRLSTDDFQCPRDSRQALLDVRQLVSQVHPFK